MIVTKTSVPRSNDLQLRKLISFLQSKNYLFIGCYITFPNYRLYCVIKNQNLWSRVG